jgi:outer membrane protein assembly factor BamB
VTNKPTAKFARCPLKPARLATLVLPWLLPFGGQAEDWPQWRGPNRDGVWSETETCQTFPSNKLAIRWRAPVGYGFSSPVVARGRVCVTDSQLDKPNARERILCFEEATGRPLWTYSHDVSFPEWAFTPGQEKGPNATPIIRDGKVYVLGCLGHLFCLDARKGGVLWKKDLAKEYGFDPLQTTSASPLIEGKLLIVLLGGKPCVLAVDRNTGKEVWKALDESAAHSSPIVIKADGARQLVVWTQQSVSGLDPETGKVQWREQLPTLSDYSVATPVFSNGRLLLSGLMLKLDGDKPAAAVLWPEARSPTRRVLSNTSTPLLCDDCVFSAKSSGELVCLEAATGKTLWETNTVTDLRGGASIHLTVNGDSVLLFNNRGELIRGQLTARGYHEISRAALLEPTYPFGGRNVAWAAPAYANRHVFARSEKELVCASLAATR